MNLSMERGMKKWAAFQAITPQFEGIKRILYDQKKVPRPVLDENKADEINQALVMGYNRKLEIIITYYDDGFFKICKGRLKHINTIHRCLEIRTLEGFIHVIPYVDIVSVDIM